jgi:hypothetical protein
MLNNTASSSLVNVKRKLLCYFFYLLEILALHSTLIYQFYFKWLGNVFLDEVHHAKISSQEKVLHI